MRSLNIPFTVLLMCGAAFAQSHREAQKAADAVSGSLPRYEVVFSDAQDYPSLPWSPSGEHSIESQCDGDGNVYLWVPAKGLVALTPKGIVSYLIAKIDDIPHPNVTYIDSNVSISAAGIYFPVSGYTDDDLETRDNVWTDKQGYRHTQQERRVLRTEQYIAHFDPDGKYRGAIKDIPPFAGRIAVFDSGMILAQGLDEWKIPRVGLMNDSGRVLRYLELPKDISATQEPAPDLKKPCAGCRYPASSVAIFSHFYQWHEKILLLRSGMNSTIIYEIRDSGAVRVVQVKLPDGRSNTLMAPSDANWFIWGRKNDSDEPPTLFEVDPESGEVRGEYRAKNPEVHIACYANGEFWGVRFDKDQQTLRVVRGTAQPSQPE